MKKIFAIALALVMVLSMASAFAFYCDGINWNCTTNSINCNKATVDIVEMARTASACGFDFAQNSCAAALPGERVYFAIKVTIPEDINPEWQAKTSLMVKATGTDIGTTSFPATFTMPIAGLKAGTYWVTKKGATDASNWALTNGMTFEKVNSVFEFGTEQVFSAEVKKANAKICAGLYTEEFSGTNMNLNLGDYTVHFAAANEKVTTVYISNGTYAAQLVLTGPDGKVTEIKVQKAALYDPNGNPVKHYVGYVDGGAQYKYLDQATNTYKAENMSCGEAAFVKAALDLLKLDFNKECVTYKAVKANFGFGGIEDMVTDCTGYKSAPAAVVNPECQVAIPKTGDVSVVAYAVMALVAAAGAMGLKK